MKILVGILDWGLGHATRSIPLIHHMLQFQCQIFIAASGPQRKILQETFPVVRFLEPPPYGIRYPAPGRNMQMAIIRQLPRLYKVIRREQHWVEQEQRKNGFDLIISDNRYGFYHKDVKSIFITHQLSPRTGWGPIFDAALRAMHYRFIGHFSECWIPDMEAGGGLAGALSHPPTIPPHARYIGMISRLERVPGNNLYNILVLISGPEPARSAFETVMREQLQDYQGTWMLVRGLPESTDTDQPNVRNHVGATELEKLMSASSLIICRSGYTTIMDLLKLRKKAVLVPTTGQTEQEYLAAYLEEKGVFPFIEQDRINLRAVFEKAGTFSYQTTETDFDAYKEAVNKLINR